MGTFLVNFLLILEGRLPKPERRDEIADINQWSDHFPYRSCSFDPGQTAYRITGHPRMTKAKSYTIEYLHFKKALRKEWRKQAIVYATSAEMSWDNYASAILEH